jgi:magnesium transporter
MSENLAQGKHGMQMQMLSSPGCTPSVCVHSAAMTPVEPDLDELLRLLQSRAPHEAADTLQNLAPALAVQALTRLNPMVAQQILKELEDQQRCEILAAAPVEKARQWMGNQAYPEDSVGWLMEPPVGIFRAHMTVAETIEGLRRLTRKAIITYGYVTDEQNRLLGVLVMRDLLLAQPDQRLKEVMDTHDVFWLEPQMELTAAMRSTVNRHFPVYPVCDPDGRLLGLVRGQNLFEARAIEISAQAGTMVGVEKEERLATPILRSLRFRHPWLQVNLLTCFMAAAVITLFQDTLDRIVLLAAFLPVLAGQSGNTGCQALAVALRGLTLGDLRSGEERRLVVKEGMLGLLNGVLVGITSGLGMWGYAAWQGHASAATLGLVVFIAMIVSCIVSSVAGAWIPLLLRRLGTDPATASSIFLTTATDVFSMGLFLALATWLVPG